MTVLAGGDLEKQIAAVGQLGPVAALLWFRVLDLSRAQSSDQSRHAG